MSNATLTYRSLRARLTPLLGEGEARAVLDLLLEEVFSMSRADVLCGSVERLSPADAARLDAAVRRLETFEPVQYVIGHAVFCNRRFSVAPGVLIPRPETEELCTLITSESATFKSPYILDIGTGSGCIACTLDLDMPGSHVSAWDISPSALAIANRNADALHAHVSFKQQDALHAPVDSEMWDIIVSNPPYICMKEKTSMDSNVLDHEPHNALFVPDSDPLLFYRAIARYAVIALKPSGRLYFEINPLYAFPLKTMLLETGFKTVNIIKDEWGKERMVSSVLNDVD